MNKQHVHISVDDCLFMLLDLVSGEHDYQSVFEQPMFAFFKELHQLYGAVFSCYCFFQDWETGRDLSELSNMFADEFQANGDWLRLGFHGLDRRTAYGDTAFQVQNMHDDYEPAKADYVQVISHLERITGGGTCIDRMPRVHYYAGSQEAVRAWREAGNGIQGLLSAEDNRRCYYHSSQQQEQLLQVGYLRDDEEELAFFRTCLRLEQTADIHCWLERVSIDPALKDIIIFIHECWLKKEDIREKIKQCTRFFFQRGYDFGFPQDWIDLK